MSVFAQRLKELRTERKLTQKQLGVLLDSTEDCVYFWEKGRSEPSIDEILRLAEIFEVTTDYLLGRIDFLNFYGRPLSKLRPARHCRAGRNSVYQMQERRSVELCQRAQGG